MNSIQEKILGGRYKFTGGLAGGLVSTSLIEHRHLVGSLQYALKQFELKTVEHFLAFLARRGLYYKKDAIATTSHCQNDTLSAKFFLGHSAEPPLVSRLRHYLKSLLVKLSSFLKYMPF